MSQKGAGALRHIIELYEPTEGTSPNGAPIRNLLIKSAKTRAAVWQSKVAQKEAGDSEQIIADYRVKIRWRDIKTGWFVLWRDQLMRVIAVDDSHPLQQYKTISVTTENAVVEMVQTDNSIVDDAAAQLYQLVHFGQWGE